MDNKVDNVAQISIKTSASDLDISGYCGMREMLASTAVTT